MRAGWSMALAFALCASGPALSQEAASSSVVTPPRVVPTIAKRHPSRAAVLGRPRIDLPPSAREEGHNGTAIWTAAVGADGKLTGLSLKRSSRSAVIDRLVKEWAETATYVSATDIDGQKISGSVEVQGSFGLYSADGPGGGMSGYTCGDLVREGTWFAKGNAGRTAIFWPENAFVSVEGIEAMRNGRIGTIAQREADRARRARLWRSLLKKCADNPDAPMVDYVDMPQAYRRLVEWR